MKTTIYFVRHAQPLHSWTGADSLRPLTDEGLADTNVVTQFLNDRRIDEYHSSPAVRCIETIRPAAEIASQKIVLHPLLIERTSGPNGNTLPLFEQRWNDHTFHEPGGESIKAVQTRAVPELERLILQTQGKTLVLGTHGTLFACLRNYYDPTFSYPNFQRLMDWMPFITEMTFEGTSQIGITEHLHLYKKYTG